MTTDEFPDFPSACPHCGERMKTIWKRNQAGDAVCHHECPECGATTDWYIGLIDDEGGGMSEIPAGTPVFSHEGSPPPDFDEQAKLYRKNVPVQALRIEGEFICLTSEGPLTCKDGYVCRDSRGYFYPVATDEFENIYEEVEVEVKG